MHAEASVIFDFEAAPKETVEECNLCGTVGGFLHEGFWDRYGFPQQCVRCPNCDLVFLSPRLTKEAYRDFYERAYRPLVSAYHGREITPGTLWLDQSHYAQKLGRFLLQRITSCRRVLDVGGSTGTVGKFIASAYRAVPTILDPNAKELAYADECEAILSPVESWDPKGRTWDLILLCQTVDHLTDIAGTLRKLRGCLAPGGHLFVDILDYDQTREIKVDHQFNLTRDTMEAYLAMTGWRPVLNADTANKHVAYLCEGV